MWAILATATSKPLTEADLKPGAAEFDKTFRFGPVKIKLVPLYTSVKIFIGLIMSIFLLQFIYSSVRKRTQECENIDEMNPKIYTICPKGRT